MSIEERIKICNSLSDVCREFKFSNNGRGIGKAKLLISDNNLDISHFNKNRNIIYPNINKNCPICDKVFEAKSGHSREKKTCSYSCSNTLFRTGENNGNWKENYYRSTCFLYHKKECIICGEEKIVEVHHLDEDSKNNKPENLIPLCPTHHQYWHSRYKIEIEKKITDYIEKFKISKCI